MRQIALVRCSYFTFCDKTFRFLIDGAEVVHSVLKDRLPYLPASLMMRGYLQIAESQVLYVMTTLDRLGIARISYMYINIALVEVATFSAYLCFMQQLY